MTRLQRIVLVIGGIACVYVSLITQDRQTVCRWIDEAERISILIEIKNSKR